MTVRRTIGAGIVGTLVWSSAAQAGNVSAQGNVTALTNANQMGPLIGTANYDEGPVNGGVPLGTYTPVGMTFFTGPLTQILPGVVTPGNAAQPIYQTDCALYFPAPQNGGVCNAQYTFYGGAVKFTQTVTQVGLTASRNGTQYLTVWDQNGVMLGQVTWTPANDSSFIGIDTNGVPIGMATYGNDDLWSGGTYNIGGSTIISDTWVWSAGAGCADDAACDDGDACNGAETCVNAACQPGTPPDCEDNNVCTDDSCDANQGCVNTNNAAPCDDGDACTENDACAEGSCGGGGAVDCADKDVCTEDLCDPNLGCQNSPIGGCCVDDGDCGIDEICDNNACVPAGGTTSTTGTTGTTDATDTDTTDTSGTTTDDTTDGVSSTSTTGPDTTTDTTGTTTTDTTTTDTTTTGGGGSDSASGTGAPTTGGGGGTTDQPGGTSTGSSTGDSATSGSGLDDGGCNCDAHGAATPWGWSLLALLGLGRRRRRVG